MTATSQTTMKRKSKPSKKVLEAMAVKNLDTPLPPKKRGPGRPRKTEVTGSKAQVNISPAQYHLLVDLTGIIACSRLCQGEARFHSEGGDGGSQSRYSEGKPKLT